MVADTIRNSLEYVEENIKNKIVLEDIARSVNVSKFHLHRLMTSVVKRPFMDYVRARKLAETMGMLVNTAYTILDVSREYAFDYEQTYINAFKREFGVTPNLFRKGRHAIEITEKADIPHMERVQEGIVLEPLFLFKPCLKLMGICHHFSFEENSKNFIATQKGNDFFYCHRQKIKNPVNPMVYMGFTRWSPIEPNYNLYMPSIEVKDTCVVPEGMSCENIGPHKYAVFRFIGAIHPRKLTWKHLCDIKHYMYSKWLPNAPYQVAEPFEVEYIDTSLALEDYCEVDIYLPVQEKADLTQIKRRLYETQSPID